IVLILTADFMMSIDNVIAVAGAAHGSYVLLIAGLLISMPLLMTTGGAISMLIDKFKWLVFVGAAAICFTGIRMALEDKFVESRIHLPGGVVFAIAVAAGLLIPALFTWLNRRRSPKSGARTT
ncbi:MAG: TerC family protein, partial [Dehalococcoidia bacterium]|nr:TerC family protein [Dehalococcoidia bacterium]